MPRGDRTGPWGLGPMTGRAAGFCAGFGAPGYLNPWPGRGRGRGRGWGRGFGFGRGRGWRRGLGWWAPPAWPWWVPPGPYTAPDPELEKDYLKEEAEALREELSRIEKRLAELEREKTE
ncbi:DUF5320 domain-containing protein [Thermodesulforhabdus norvegica]|uniref:DUF5320 domain-containing protein n=1 Tax=Thermodesulforhabdus norvegica TaxID=39841 RepID=A0A1I4VT63_9BACT|nr:DUF5320 domain-containing protein [Thermodesulforhabdus norvegica]SFN04186.1 hypothetical protein SAMN05660836_02446 [Thermodesulforhabdus norvegica]